jgi:hypothetical protein
LPLAEWDWVAPGACPAGRNETRLARRVRLIVEAVVVAREASATPGAPEAELREIDGFPGLFRARGARVHLSAELTLPHSVDVSCYGQRKQPPRPFPPSSEVSAPTPV